MCISRKRTTAGRSATLEEPTALATRSHVCRTSGRASWLGTPGGGALSWGYAARQCAARATCGGAACGQSWR
eukprot:6747490-Prymnesium_polylepis.1